MKIHVFENKTFLKYFIISFYAFYFFTHIVDFLQTISVLPNWRIYFKIIYLILSVPLVFYQLFTIYESIRSKKINRIIVYTLFLFLLILFVILFNILFIHGLHYRDYLNRKVSLYYIQIFYHMFLFLALGTFIKDYFFSKFFRSMIITFFSMIVLIVIFNIDTSSMLLVKNAPWMAYDFLFISIFVVSFFRDHRIKIHFLIIFSMIILFFLWQRGALISFAFVYFSFFLISLQKKQLFLFVIVLSLILASFLLFRTDFQKLPISNHRVFALISGKKDTSKSERIKQIYRGFDSIKRHWFWGEFAGQLKWRNNIGDYMHNYLSIYRQFGLLPFIGFLYIYILLIMNTIRILKLKSLSSIQLFVFFGVASSTFLIIFVESFSFFNFWFWVGANNALLTARSDFVSN